MSTDLPPADPTDAAAHFEAQLRFATDCADVHAALSDPPFVLLDVRSDAAYARGHVPGATSLPHRRIDDDALAAFPDDAWFVVYCAGPHCNGADRAALRLARLGRRAKRMDGGITGWRDEGFALAT